MNNLGENTLEECPLGEYSLDDFKADIDYVFGSLAQNIIVMDASYRTYAVYRFEIKIRENYHTVRIFLSPEQEKWLAFVVPHLRGDTVNGASPREAMLALKNALYEVN
jgi:hypothetical protein